MLVRCPVCEHEYESGELEPDDLAICSVCGNDFAAQEVLTVQVEPLPVPAPVASLPAAIETEPRKADLAGSVEMVGNGFSLKRMLAVLGGALTLLLLLAKGGKIIYCISQALGGLGSGDLQVVDQRSSMISSQVCQCSGTIKNRGSRPARNVSVSINLCDNDTGMRTDGIASDFTPEIAPGGTWHFHATCPVPGGPQDFGGMSPYPVGSLRNPNASGSAWSGMGGGGMGGGMPSSRSRSVHCEVGRISGSF